MKKRGQERMGDVPDKDELKILFVSSVAAEKSLGGYLVMYLHLHTDSRIIALELTDAEWQQADAYQGWRRWLVLAINRISSSRFHGFASQLRILLSGVLLPNVRLQEFRGFQPDVVLTVAHGQLFWVARSIARKLGRPLAVIFYDWWPYLGVELKEVSPWLKPLIQKRFFRLHRESACVFPICSGMQNSLGAHRNSIVLLPLTDFAASRPMPSPKAGSPISLTYIGNMSKGYGAQLRTLVSAISQESEIRLKLVGNAADWPERDRSAAVERGILAPGFRTEEELDRVLSASTALLVVLGFDYEPDIFMQTSFPSKIAKYIAYRKPIFFWGPPGSSIARFCDEQGLNTLVTARDPLRLLELIRDLNADEKKLAVELAKYEALANLFDPKRLKDLFYSTLRGIR